jgi:hypothetical protein
LARQNVARFVASATQSALKNQSSVGQLVTDNQNDSRTDAILGCNEIEAALSRLRELLRDAESYRKQAFYESVEALYDEIALALDRSWNAFEDISKGLPE